jgi:hypothetical protein
MAKRNFESARTECGIICIRIATSGWLSEHENESLSFMGDGEFLE